MKELVFPIDRVKSDIQDLIRKKDFLIIKSTPGSGKTTRVPLFLREIFSRKIYILEPRKLAAKLASKYVAESIGEKPGQQVGHIFRYENQTSSATQIIFLTEGTFIRLLSEDHYLDNADVVILDEFHERHFQTDIALSFLVEIKKRNPRLKIIIMSATLELSELENFLGSDVAVVELNERKHQLAIQYLPNNTLVLKESLEKKVLNALSENWHRPGHFLIFLPGMSEIRKCEELLSGKFRAEINVLHSEAGNVEIDESFYDLNKKRIILSTNIAESSVTIPGVRTVIDSGLHRTSELNVVTRLSQVVLKKISQSSAIQRANRASREADGLAVRLYAELDYQSRVAFDTPEINRIDLSELIMTSAELFQKSPRDLRFVSPLNVKELERSEKFLEETGLLTNKQLTAEGKNIARAPFHPRIGKILSVAADGNESGFSTVLRFLAGMIESKRPDRFITLARKYFKAHGNKTIDVEKCLLYGYADQLAKLQNKYQFIHNNGEVYQIAETLRDEIHPDHQLWIILGLDNRNFVTRAVAVEEDWLYDLPSFPVTEEEQYEFDSERLKLKIERITKIGSIILSREKIVSDQFSDSALNFVVKKVTSLFDDSLNDSAYVRLLVLEKYSSRKIAAFDKTSWLLEQVPLLLRDESYTISAMKDNYITDLFHYLDPDNFYDLERDLPLYLQLHDKRKVPLYYHPANGIHCESYIQDFYGLTSAPVILKGKERVKIHLLGPHKRALQVTQDLNSFWFNTYKEMQKELKREYPRHYWPENPALAKPILLQRNAT